MVTQANNQVMINNIKQNVMCVHVKQYIKIFLDFISQFILEKCPAADMTALHVYTGVFTEVSIPVQMVCITTGHILRLYE